MDCMTAAQAHAWVLAHSGISHRKAAMKMRLLPQQFARHLFQARKKARALGLRIECNERKPIETGMDNLRQLAAEAGLVKK